MAEKTEFDINRERIEEMLQELPLYYYDFFSPKELEFSDRIRYICEHDCQQYGKSWACPPGVGSVESCRKKVLGYRRVLLIATITEVEDISDIQATLDTRSDHEEITNQVADILRAAGENPYVLSTESCAICSRCACLDGQPCRFPEQMHPCVESHGINIIPALEKRGLDFQYGSNIVTWVSLLLY